VEQIKDTPRATIVGLVTPHLLRIVDLAHEAEKVMNVDWHLRDAVTRSMDELAGLWNAQAATSAYLEALESAISQAAKHREHYIRALRIAAEAAQRLRRD
jgi:hypothetical protein